MKTDSKYYTQNTLIEQSQRLTRSVALGSCAAYSPYCSKASCCEQMNNYKSCLYTMLLIVALNGLQDYSMFMLS